MTQKLPKLVRWISSFYPVFILVILYGCASTVETGGKRGLALEKFREALKFGSLNDNKGMIASLKEASKLDPGNPNYHVYLGTTYFVEGDVDNAEKEFIKTLEIDRNNKNSYRQLGRIYMQKGEWEKAVINFQEDLKRPGTPYPLRSYNWLALCYFKLGKYDRAEKIWLNALKMKDNAAIRLNLALAYKDLERFEQAMDSLKRASLLNSKMPQVHYEMARLYVREKKNDEAVKHFKEVIRLAPGSDRAKASREFLDLLQARN